MKFIFAHPVDLLGIRIKFVHEGHRVKFKVTEAKRSENLFSQCKSLIGNNSVSITPLSLRAAWGFRLWRIGWCDCYPCQM